MGENGELLGGPGYPAEMTEGYRKNFGCQGWARNAVCLGFCIPNRSQVGSIVIVSPNEDKYDYI